MPPMMRPEQESEDLDDDHFDKPFGLRHHRD